VLPMKCGSCGNTELRPTAKFCDECGTPTMPTTPADEAAEYKQVTVLFADVVRSMDIAAAVDPERLRDIMSELLSRSNEVVRRHGGIVDKFTGDGVMALFGVEHGPAEGARRALGAAQAMVDSVSALSREFASDIGAPLRLGIGIHVGPAVVGHMGYGDTVYLTAVGDTVHVASRLEQLTKDYDCELVVSDEVAARAGLDASAFARHELTVRNRDAPLAVLVIPRAQDLPLGPVAVRP